MLRHVILITCQMLSICAFSQSNGGVKFYTVSDPIGNMSKKMLVEKPFASDKLTPGLIPLCDRNAAECSGAPPPGPAPTYHYRSITNGNWNSPTTWERSANNISWSSSPDFPVLSSETITIRSGHTVNVTASITIDETVVEPTGMLVIAAGSNLTVVSGGLLLQSNANGTARIGNSAGTISGNITVQRFIPSKPSRKWTFVTAPVSQAISTAWQQQVFITGTGTGGTVCATIHSNGFDATSANSPSMFTYNPVAVNGSRWTSIPGTTTALTPGKGYRVNIRGSRGAGDANCGSQLNSATPPTPDAVVLSATGAMVNGVNIGNVNVPVFGRTSYGVSSPNNAFTLIGNPYPGEISLQALKTSNSGITSSFWFYSPHNNSNNYSTYNSSVGQALNFPSGYNNGTVPDVIIASGQAFFVERNLDADGQVTFQESHKSTTATSGNTFFRRGAITDKVRVELKDGADTNNIDEIYINFLNEEGVFNNDITEYDSRSFNVGNVLYLASDKNGAALSIQTRKTIIASDTIRLRFDAPAGAHTLKFTEYENFVAAQRMVLIDKFLGTTHDISTSPAYSFTVTSDPGSKGNARFAIAFQNRAVLPVDFLTISAQPVSNTVAVTWKVASEVNITSYNVERSADGRNFEKVASVVSRNIPTTADYSLIDNNPLPGTSFYRIEANGGNGEKKYSSIAKVNFAKALPALVFYPNPVKDHLNITVGQPFSGKSVIKITTANGVVVFKGGIESGRNSIVVNTSAFLPGLYLIELTDSKGQKTLKKFIK